MAPLRERIINAVSAAKAEAEAADQERRTADALEAHACMVVAFAALNCDASEVPQPEWDAHADAWLCEVDGLVLGRDSEGMWFYLPCRCCQRLTPAEAFYEENALRCAYPIVTDPETHRKRCWECRNGEGTPKKEPLRLDWFVSDPLPSNRELQDLLNAWEGDDREIFAPTHSGAGWTVIATKEASR